MGEPRARVGAFIAKSSVMRQALLFFVLLLTHAAPVLGAMAPRLGPSKTAQAVAPWLVSPMIAAPSFDTVGDGRAIPNGIVTALAQDRVGFLWLGSTDGLIRYDGYRFSRIPIAGAPEVYVRALMPAQDGRLWVALQGAGLFVLDAATGQFSRPASGALDANRLVQSDALAMAEDRDGSVWIAHAQDGLDQISADGTEMRSYLPGTSVRTLLVDPQGDLWIGGRAGLMRKRSGSDRIEPVPGFEDQYVYSLYASSDGRVWVGTQANGAAVVQPTSGVVMRLPLAPDPDGVSHPWVAGFVERVPGELWLATFGGGVEVRDLATGRLLRQFRHSAAQVGSLAMDRVPGLVRDNSGLLWVPTWGAGLQRLAAGSLAVQVLQQQPSMSGTLRHPTVMSTLSMPQGQLWIGSGGFGIDVLDVASQRVVRSFDQASGLTDGTVRALAHGVDGDVWIGTQQAGVLRWRQRTGRMEALSADWPERRVRRLATSRDGGVWVGLEVGLRHLDAQGHLSAPMEGGPDARVDQPIWAISEDASGGLWVGTPSGLLRKEPDSPSLRSVDFNDAEASAAGTRRSRGVLDILVAKSGELWLLAQGGLHRGALKSGTWIFETVLNAAEVPQGLGVQLIEDRDGVLWTGRIRFDPKSARWESLGPPEGFTAGNPVWPAGTLMQDGRVVLGSTSGLTFIAPERFEHWSFEPSVVMTAVDIDGRAATVSAKGLVLPAGARRLAVEFAALDFSDPEVLHYRYRLDGQDEDWVTASVNQRVAAYGNLWPGEYVLRVQGSNRVGDWSPHELALPIRVEAAFWQTPWFALLALLAFLSLMLGAVHWRGRRAEQQGRRLQALVEERTNELLSTRNAAESALLELRTAQRQLVEAEKMASLGQLVAGVAHELNTPMGNALVVSSALQEQCLALRSAVDEGRLKRSDLDQFLVTLFEASGLIVRSIGRAHELVSSFKQVAVDRSSSQRRSFDLAVVAREALDMLAPSLRHAAWRVELAIPKGIVLESYPGAIGQIMTNMVNNAALHAFPEGQEGLLRIDAEVLEQTGEVLVRFSDDGDGMEEDICRRVFDPFFTTRMGRGGTGLGLNIVYNLVTQLLGGTISVQSAPGAGTCFEIILPLVAPTGRMPEPAQPEGA
jgi:signal transduction histidine kinase/ligand-binding sensor domain-containing protein